MPLDARGRFDELFVAGREAGTAEAFAVFTERRAGDDGDFFRLQQADGKIFFRHAGGTHVGKRVERAARQMAFQTDFIEPAHDEVAATMILVAHFLHAFLTVGEGFDGGFLADDRRAKH